MLFAGLAGYALAFCLPSLWARLTFTGILQHQEGQTIYILHRMMESVANLYVAPSIEAASLIYNPACYLYLWLLHPLLGDQIVHIRFASVVAPLGLSLMFIEIAGRRFMKVRRLGLLTGMIWLVVNPQFAWIDLARPDALFLLSIVVVWFALCLDDRWKAKQLMVGATIALAFSVKQHGALLAAAPLLLALADRRYLAGVAVAALGCGVVVLATWLAYGENYIDWAFREPASHPFSIADGLAMLQRVAVFMPFAFAAPLAVTAIRSDPHSAEKKLVVVALVTFAASLLSAGKDGGSYANYNLFVLIGSIAAARLLLDLATLNGARSQLVAAGLGLMVAWTIWSNESAGMRARVTPTALDAAAQAAFIDFSRRIAGEPWATTWPQADLWAGHQMKAPVQSRRAIDADPDDASLLESHRFEAIFLSDALDRWSINREVRRSYTWCFAIAEFFQLQTIAGRMFHPTDALAPSAEACLRLRDLAAITRRAA